MCVRTVAGMVSRKQTVLVTYLQIHFKHTRLWYGLVWTLLLLWWHISSCTVCAGIVTKPFMTGSIMLNGDLREEIKLGSIIFRNGNHLPMKLCHKSVRCTGDTQRSTWIQSLLDSCISQTDKHVFVWSAPDGEDRTLNDDDPSIADATEKWTLKHKDGYQVLVTNNKGSEYIYYKGALERATLDDGTRLELVKDDAGNMTLYEEGLDGPEVLLTQTVTLNPPVEELRRKDGVARIEYDPHTMLLVRAVDLSCNLDWELSYVDHKLSAVKSNGIIVSEFLWRPCQLSSLSLSYNGLPFHLAFDGLFSYTYRVDGARIFIETFREDSTVKTVVDTRLRTIEQSDNGVTTRWRVDVANRMHMRIGE
jgi:hypothetical protein